MKRLWLLLLLLLLCCACNEEKVLEGISQKQANEVVCMLGEWGIPASLEKDGRSKTDNYSVTVKRGRALEARNYIREEKGFSENEELEKISKKTCDEDGFFSVKTDKQIAMCADRALELKIEKNLQEFLGVISANVIITRATEKNTDKTSVLVAIKTKESNKELEFEVRKMVNGVLPDVAEENLTVSVYKIPSAKQHYNLVGVSAEDEGIIAKPLVPFLGFWNIPESDFNSFSISVTIAISLALLIGAVTGYMLSLVKKRGTSGDESDTSDIVSFRDDTVTRTGKEL